MNVKLSRSNPGRAVSETPAMLPRSSTGDAAPVARALLAALAGANALSGSALARGLGVSRTAVWKQIERLRQAGVDIDAQAGSGYRLAAPIELLDADALRAVAAPSTCERLGDLAVHWQLDSTSSELRRRAEHDPRDLLACFAEMQSAGRGRRGRQWRMLLGGGIALSVLKRFDAAMASLAGLSLAVGVAAADALADCGVAGVGLKWPNDLVARDAKLGGILIELGGDALGPCHAVVGIGINVRLGATRGAIDQPSIDLAELAPGLARTRVAGALLDRLVAALDCFARDGFAPFADAFAHRDALRGRAVDVLHGGARRSGVACGIDARGALRVEIDGVVESVDGGEVSVRARP